MNRSAPISPVSSPIAIVGVGLRFPGGAVDAASFWHLLEGGVDAIGEVPTERWDWRKFYDLDPASPGKAYVHRGGFLRDPVDGFDAAFFGISPREAAVLDPQQRLLLETSWEAIEDAGIDAEALRASRTGVFIGAFGLDSMIQQLGVLSREAITSHTSTSATMAILANRLSYFFDLRGPSLSVDTACSASLVAFHLACQSIWRGESEQALAGGVNVMLRPEYGIAMCKGGFLSPDARCMAFDARANGYVRGEGAGVVVLRPLADAVAAGDRIYALVRATGANQDGQTNGITVPSLDSQRALVREVLEAGGVAPHQVSYVEAHGTGTQAGDPVEAQSLGEALGAGRMAGTEAWIGSVKTQIGHLEGAAGIAGLIKAALALHHRKVPANLHFREPNPRIDFDVLGLRVPTKVETLPPTGPLFGSVNSFGYGGTNAHVLLETGPEGAAVTQASREASAPLLFPLSAHGEAALRALAGAAAAQLSADPERFEAFARTAGTRRAHLPTRLLCWGDSAEEVAAALRAFAAGGRAPNLVSGTGADGHRRLAWIYTGMGAQWWGMARELHDREPVFRRAMEACDEVFSPLSGWSLTDLFGGDAALGALGGTRGSPMAAPRFAQPGNLALQIGLTELWRSVGLEADLLLGHSVGEIAAAWAAGVLPLDEAFRLTHHRSELQQGLAGRGGMVAVGIGVDEALELLLPYEGRVDIAAYNGPASLTLAGDPAALEEIQHELDARGAFHRSVRVEVAYHSAQMDEIAAEFRRRVGAVQARKGSWTLLSSVTGGRVRGEELDVAYWWRNARDPVRFADALGAATAEGVDAFLEIGPNPVLAPSIVETLGRDAVRVIAASQKRGEDPTSTFYGSFGALYAAGCAIDWSRAVPAAPFQRLPTYPFQRERHWVESDRSRSDRLSTGPHPLLATPVDGPATAFEGELSGSVLPWLKDHRVLAEVLLPGAAYVTAALALARHAGRPPVLEQLRFHRALVVEGVLRLRTSLDPAGDGVSFHSHRPGVEEGAWQPHATVRLGGHRPPREERVDLAAVRSRLGEPRSGGSLYRRLLDRGLEYGPTFRGIESLRSGPGEALAELRIPDALAGEAELEVHPALLDSAFQALIGCVPDSGDTAAFVPVRIGAVRVHAVPGTRAMAHARLTRSSAGSLEGDIVLCDDRGTPLVEVMGLRCQAVSQRREDAIGPLLYAEEWRVEPELPPLPEGAGCWLVLGEPGAVETEVLATALRGAGRKVEVTSHPGGPGGLEGHPATGNPLAGVLLHLASPPDDASDGARGASALLATVQALCAAPNDSVPRLVVATRGGQPTRGGEEVVPASAAAWGLARVAAAEHPELACRRIDLPPEGSVALAPDLLARAILADDGEEERALRGDGSLVPRLVPAPQMPETVSDAPCVLTVARPGSLDGMRFVTAPRRAPGPGEVEIEVRTASLNFKDLMKVMNLLPPSYLEETFYGPHLGLESAGVVVRVGEGVEDFATGDAVVSPDGEGTFRRFNTVSTRYLVHKPTPLTFEEAPAFINYITPYYGMYEMGRLQAGERVLIHSAAGGVGLAAVQIARWRGAEVFATAGSDGKRDYLRSLGIEHVFDSRSLAFADAIPSATDGRGVDMVLNSLSGEALRAGLGLLAPFGRFIEIGKRDIIDDANLRLAAFDRNLGFLAVDIDRMMAEAPPLFRRMLDEVWTLLEDGTLEPLPTEAFPASRATEAFQSFARARHTGKVVLRMDDPEIAVTPAVRTGAWVSPELPYIVTGGLGGFGLELARWLAAEGARHLSLWGRSGAATAEQRAAVEALRLQGVEVDVRALDVSDPAQVEAAVAEVAARTGRLGGVFHAAMVLDDGTLAQLDPHRLEAVLAPKARGGWNLHQATREIPTEHFVALSSISSVIGNAGQGSYVAANAYLDGLVHLRRAEGLPALGVNLGAIARVGVVARSASTERHLARLGVRAMEPKTCLAALDRALREGRTRVTVAEVDFAAWAEVAGRVPTRLADLVDHAGTGATARMGTLADAVRNSPPGERTALLVSGLAAVLARVLHTEPERIDAGVGLDRLGVDSLMAAELANAIRMALEIELSSMVLLQGPSLMELSARILPQLTGDEVGSVPPPSAAETAPDAIDEMSEEELDHLLATFE